MNIFNLENAFREKKDKNWKHLFIAIDLHATIIPPTYTFNNEGREFYPGAKEVLQWMTKRDDIVLILWTSSHHKPVKDILKWLNKQDIRFNYVNANPMCQNTELCDFSRKFYLNIILDDKAGFEGETDWMLIKKELRRIGEWEPKQQWSFDGCFWGVDLKKIFKKLAP